jgi:hypothetical protein
VDHRRVVCPAAPGARVLHRNCVAVLEAGKVHLALEALGEFIRRVGRVDPVLPDAVDRDVPGLPLLLDQTEVEDLVDLEVLPARPQDAGAPSG